MKDLQKAKNELAFLRITGLSDSDIVRALRNKEALEKIGYTEDDKDLICDVYELLAKKED